MKNERIEGASKVCFLKSTPKSPKGDFEVFKPPLGGWG